MTARADRRHERADRARIVLDEVATFRCVQWVSTGTDWADLLRVLPYREASPELTERDIRRVQQGKATFVGLAVGQGHATTDLADGARVYPVTGPDASTWTPVRGR